MASCRDSSVVYKKIILKYNLTRDLIDYSIKGHSFKAIRFIEKSTTPDLALVNFFAEAHAVNHLFWSFPPPIMEHELYCNY